MLNALGYNTGVVCQKLSVSQSDIQSMLKRNQPPMRLEQWNRPAPQAKSGACNFAVSYKRYRDKKDLPKLTHHQPAFGEHSGICLSKLFFARCLLMLIGQRFGLMGYVGALFFPAE